MNTIAVILARKGSKRIPRKNVLDFFGKPLVAWTIEAALLSKCFDRVLLSTDCDEIAKIGLDYGAEVPFLRDRAFDDFATSSEATIASLDQAERHWNEDYDVVAQLMANCPLRSFIDIRNSMSAFHRDQHSAQISCFKFGWMNPWWAATLDDSKHPSWLFKEQISGRSQDLPDLFCPTGAIWISRTPDLRLAKTFYTSDVAFYELPWQSSMDIDDQSDLAMAKVLFEMNQSLI